MENRTDGLHARATGVMVLLLLSLMSAGAIMALAGPATGQTSTSTSTAFTNSASVTIKNYAYTPDNITVVLGVNNTVVWTNDDNVNHTVVAADNSFSGLLTPGASFSHTFVAAGVYNYHCNIHTFMKGTVVVLAGPTSTTTSATSISSSVGANPASVPEFPLEAIGAVAITVVVLAAYLIARQARRG